jgi:hypothetical protein
MQKQQLAQAELELFETPIVLPTDRVRAALYPRYRSPAADEDEFRTRTVEFANEVMNSTARSAGMHLLTFLGKGVIVEIKKVFFFDTSEVFVTLDDFVSPVVGLLQDGFASPDRGPGRIQIAIASLLVAKGFGAGQFDAFEEVVNCSEDLLSDADVRRILQICFHNGVSKKFLSAEHFMEKCYTLGLLLPDDDCDEDAEPDEDAAEG